MNYFDIKTYNFPIPKSKIKGKSVAMKKCKNHGSIKSPHRHCTKIQPKKLSHPKIQTQAKFAIFFPENSKFNFSIFKQKINKKYAKIKFSKKFFESMNSG
jgi:hypothetical protein